MHSGYLECRCAHKYRALPQPSEASLGPPPSSLLHVDGACTWSCCGEPWSAPACPPPPLHPPRKQRRHTGTLACACAHRRAAACRGAGGPGDCVHLDGVCVWDCCSQNWDAAWCPVPLAPSPSWAAHCGALRCRCGHSHTCYSLAFDPTNTSLLSDANANAITHLDSCTWECCGALWSDLRCKRPPLSHKGTLECCCGHSRLATMAGIDTPPAALLVHVDGLCKWTCCGKNWLESSCDSVPSGADENIVKKKEED